MNNFIIGTGYYKPIRDMKWLNEVKGVERDLSYIRKLWVENVRKYAPTSFVSESAYSGNRVYTINSGGDKEDDFGTWINLPGNCGHVQDIDRGFSKAKIGGWSMSWITGACIAYSSMCDFIYKEGDCLAFGPWVEQMYKDLEDQRVKMLFGKFNHALKVEHSLFIIKHEFIPVFLREYLKFEASEGGRGKLRPEAKFDLIAKAYSSSIGYLSFGYGRNRPFNPKAPVFYVQHLTKGEIELLKDEGLV